MFLIFCEYDPWLQTMKVEWHFLNHWGLGLILLWKTGIYWCCNVAEYISVVVEWTPVVSAREEVHSQTSCLSVCLSGSKKQSLSQADDGHAVWKLYRLLYGLHGPSGHGNYAAQELCKLSSQVKKNIHQKTDIWGFQVSDSSIMIVFLFSHALWPAPQAETWS